jgi:hypothetical protein
MEMSADNVVRDNATSGGEQPARSQSPQQQCLREHEPLTDILSLIPHKVINLPHNILFQNGKFKYSHKIKLNI